MPKSILDTTVSVACRSLVLVEEGWSERGALRRAVKENLDTTDRREAFRLVIDTLSRKSLVDRIVGIALGQVPKNLANLNVARLAVVCMLQTDSSDRRGALDALRRNCVDSFRPYLEKLVGDLLAHGTSEHYLSGTAEDEQLALRLGFPEWWTSYCLRMWGRHDALRLLENRGIRPRYLHVNSLRVKNITEIQPSLPGLEPVPSMPGFFRVLTEGLPGTVREYVETGTLEGQDLAAYLAVKAGEPRGNDSVLDVCAAPGGKTGALSQLMENKGSIVAADYSLGRMRDWKRMISTLGVTNASCIVEDATRAGLRLGQFFDLILVDPPCSGSGIFDKNPAMKWHMTPQRLARYGELQYKLLDQSSKFLKPGGRIVYSTCSISIEENEDVVSRFLSGNPDFQTRPTLKDWGHPGLKGYDNCRRFYPHLDGTSGYFIARLERFE